MEEQELNQEEVWNESAAEIWADEATPGPTAPPETPQETQEPTEQQEDPLSGIPDALRGEFTAMREKLSSFEEMANRLKQAESRLGSMQNDYYETKKRLEESVKAEAERRNKAAKTSQEEEDQKFEDIVNELKDSDPELFQTVTTLEKKYGVKFKGLEEQVTALVAAKAELESKLNSGGSVEEIAQLRNELAATKEELVLTDAFPGWRTIKETPEFKSWIPNSPDYIKAKFGSKKAADAIEVLKAFSETKKNKTAAEINAEKQARLRASTVAPSKPSSPIKSKSWENMTPEEQWNASAAEFWPEG